MDKKFGAITQVSQRGIAACSLKEQKGMLNLIVIKNIL